MSDENQTNNPDQPPVPSDEPLVKKDADGPKAKPDPIHWLLPILGYAYVPVVLLLASNQGDARGFLQFSLVVSLFGVPFYAAMLFGLNRMRNEHSRDQILSRTEPDTSNFVDRLSLLCGRERCIRLLENWRFFCKDFCKKLEGMSRNFYRKSFKRREPSHGV